MASELLQVPVVRLYQTALFEKSSRTLNQDTGWHQVESECWMLIMEMWLEGTGEWIILKALSHALQDLNMIPLDTGAEGYVSFWCPLTELTAERNHSLLVFATGSHRDMSVVHW